MNKASVSKRASVIREYLTQLTQCDPESIYPYSVTAARWEVLRLVIDQGKGTPGDDRRFRELSGVLRGRTEKLGLDSATDGRCGPDGRA
jgi:hypothetical protein